MFGTTKYKQEDIKNTIYPKGSSVLIVDADTVVFRIASASDKKTIIAESPKGAKRSFKNRTEFKKFLTKNSALHRLNDYKITDHIEAEPLSFCLKTLKRKIENLKKDTGSDYCEIYFGGSGNFRLDLPLPVKYKGQRPPEKPTHLKEGHEYYVKNYGSKEIIGVETDDVVQQRLVEIAKQDGVKAFLATIDKDAYQVFDEVEYNIVDIRENKIFNIQGGFGELHFLEESSKLKGSGFIWLMSQIFLLDSADNYKMNKHYKKQYGQKTFYNDFKNLKNHKEVLEKMISLWENLLPEKNEYVDFLGNNQIKTRLELAELYFSCAYMRLKAKDDTNFESFLKKYNVNYEALK